MLHHVLPCLPNDDFFLSLPALTRGWRLVLSQPLVHQMACRYRFRMAESQYRVFASQPWNSLLSRTERETAVSNNQSERLPQSRSHSLGVKDWRGECYSLFKIIRQVEMNCFSTAPADCRMPYLPVPVEVVRPRLRPRFHLPQPFQAYLIDFLTAQLVCCALGDEPCSSVQRRITQPVLVDWMIPVPIRCLCGRLSTPPRLAAVPSHLAWIPLPGLYHTTWVAVWTGPVPDICSEAVLEQLSSAARSGVEAASGPDPIIVDLECTPVFEWDDQFDRLAIAGLCARDYFQYGPVAVKFDREMYAVWASLDVCLATWGQPTYKRQRLESTRPVVLQAVSVFESWFGTALDAFPYSLWYEMTENSECSQMVSLLRKQVGRGCSLHYIDRRDLAGRVCVHIMPCIRDAAPDHCTDIWLHHMTFWHQLTRGAEMNRGVAHM